jgi:hypothetical protein
MFRFPQDKYDFRRPLFWILHFPCIAVWIYVLLFFNPVSWIPWILGTILGFLTAFALSWLFYLIGSVAFNACLKFRRNEIENTKDDRS